MTADRLYPRLPHVGFLVIALGVYAASLLIVGAGVLPRDPLLAGAVTLDLAILVPALFYLLVVRTTPLPGVAVVPVFLLSLFGASRVLPPEHHSALDLLTRLVVPAEILLVAYVGVRAYRGLRRGAERGGVERQDPLERFRAAAGEVVPVPVAAGAVAHEIAVLYYALLSWRARPDARDDELAFSYHRKNGYGGIILAAGLAGTVEMVAVHLLVGRWSATAAWVLTAVSLYGMVWLLGSFQAARLRPILLAPDALHVRVGLLWSVRVPYGRIAAVRPAERDAPQRSGRGHLHAVTFGAPQLLLELREPVEVEGPYGWVKRGVRCIGIAVDERDRFAAELRARAEASRLRALTRDPARSRGPDPV